MAAVLLSSLCIGSAVSSRGRVAEGGRFNDPPRRLSYTFTAHIEEGSHGDRPSRVTFELQPMGSSVKLTMTHDDFDEGSRVLEGVRNGWPAILSSLKSVLESGCTIEFQEAHFRG